MSEGASQVLATIPELVKERNAAGLVALQDHTDKQVRKAVRKALHTLKSRGVEIPEASPKAWTPGAGLTELRGDLSPLATVETNSVAGALRFAISEPEETEGARLLAGTISPDDRVLDFSAYTQTDGQRARLVRDWQRRIAGRSVDVAWLKGRILWAREQTVRAGFGVPRALDQALPLLGEAPSGRVSTFLTDELDGAAPLDEGKIQEVLTELGAPDWPPLVDLDPLLERAAQIHGDKPQPTEESERFELLRQSAAGESTLRSGLQGAIAQALHDAAISSWQDGAFDLARAAFDLARALQGASEPESLPWIPQLLGFQVASLLRAVGGPDAVRKAIQEQQAREVGGGHDHDHHDHDHGHDHHDHDHHGHDHG